jgi:methionyl-tRNA formyltransferase
VGLGRGVRVIFLGTPQFAVPTLEAIVGAGHHVLTVVTQPDRPRGRGHNVAFSPVKACALANSLPLWQPERIRRGDAVSVLADLNADVMVVVGYGQILPQALIDAAPLGIINVHASLLPHLRGAAPIQWAIARGDRVTGVTTMQLNAGLDTGDILLQAETEIRPEETAVELSERLSIMGAALLLSTLDGLTTGTVEAQPQDDALATHAPLLRKQDGLIQWSNTAQAIHDLVRGFQPWPGAHTVFRGRGLHVWRSRLAGISTDLAPGTLVIDSGLFAATGHGQLLELLEVQAEGRKRVSGQAFANGQHLAHNELLGRDETPESTIQ